MSYINIFPRLGLLQTQNCEYAMRNWELSFSQYVCLSIIKSGLNLGQFFSFAQISPKKVQNHYPEQILFLPIVVLRIVFGSCLEDLSQSRKLSIIKPP
jgi:hypothetical protein